MKADWYTLKEDNKVLCNLCPHNCFLKSGESGKCRVRHNVAGELHTEVFNNVSALAVDPVEKKPLYHFYPGYKILSVGSFGCNMSCAFCQNHDISQPSASIMNSRRNEINSSEIINEAVKIRSNIGLAFTYNEPVVWYEFMSEIAIKAKEAGLATVMVSNGYINKEPLEKLINYIDAFNIDLKAFNDKFYRTLTGARLAKVLSSLEIIKSHNKHLEITYLVIPGHNDDYKEFQESINWISDKLGNDTVLHLSRYFPNYNFTAPATPMNTINNLFEIASARLNFVYPGNTGLSESKDTICPDCGSVISSRSGYHIRHLNTLDGLCIKCGRIIYNHFRN